MVDHLHFVPAIYRNPPDAANSLLCVVQIPVSRLECLERALLCDLTRRAAGNGHLPDLQLTGALR
jgi:hypothetical protein